MAYFRFIGRRLGKPDGDDILVVPAEDYYISNLDFTYKRFLIFKISGNKAGEGKIIEFVGKDYNVHDHYDELVKNYNQKKIPGFTGSVLQYDVSYRMLKGQSYKNGKKESSVQAGLQTISDTTLKPLPKIISTKKNVKNTARDVGCLPVTPDLIGFPKNMDDGCWVTYLEVITYFPGGCIKSAKRYFISLSCSGGCGGSGSGGSSGYLRIAGSGTESGSGSGSGSGGGCGSYPPGGGGGDGSGSSSDGANNSSVSSEISSIITPLWWWNDTSIYYPAQPAPNWSIVYQNYPKVGNQDKPASSVYQMVGGQVYNLYQSDMDAYGNACALRVLYALNHSGINIPDKPGYTFSGKDGKYYFLSAAKLYNFISQTLGTSGSNIITLHASQGGANGSNFHSYLEGHKGIYILRPNSPGKFGATGHCTLFNNNDCLENSSGGSGCYYNAAGGVYTIRLWILDN